MNYVASGWFDRWLFFGAGCGCGGGANKFDGLRGLFVYLRKRLRHFFSVFDFCTYKSGDLADLSVGFSV